MKQRILTAAVLIPLALLIVGSTSPLPISIAAISLAAIGVYELAGMFRVGRFLPILTLGSIALPFYAIYSLRSRGFDEILVIPPILFVVGVVCLGVTAKKNKLSSSAIDVGGLWISMPFLAIMALHDLAAHPYPASAWNFVTPALLALVPVWAGDIAGIFAGKAFGKHPLSRHSPNKTVEGAVANLIAAILAGWGIGAIIHAPLGISLACGLCAGTFGQAGDIFESYIKRRAGVKDSGRLFPGHGGVLDRIDSVLFAAIPIALVVFFAPSWLRGIDVSSQNPGSEKGIRLDKTGARIVGGH